MTTKAKRKLSDISFEKDGCHIALVSKDQGGPANNQPHALILKSANQVHLEKMQQVKVTMELPEFLRKFFSLYWDESEVLARMLGYDPKLSEEEAVDAEEDDWYEEYLTEKLKSFEIIKSLDIEDAEDLQAAISDLTEDEALQLRKDQLIVEKAFRKKERLEKKASREAKQKPTENVTVTDVLKKEEQAVDVAALEKSVTDTRVALEKANEKIAAFEKAQADAVVKDKTEKVKSLVKDATQVEAMTKAALALPDEVYVEFVKSLEVLSKQVETSALFKETGTTQTEDKPEEGSVAKILKAKFAK